MTYLLVDGNNLFSRMYYGRFDESNATITTEFLNAVRWHASNLNASHIFVAWDGGNSWRKKVFPAYKQTRKEKDERYFLVMDQCKALLRKAGYETAQQEGQEADDLIATAAASLNGSSAFILSSDKDLMQCVTETIHMYRLGSDELFDPPAVKRYLGVQPKNVPDYFALVGDSSDNIKGVHLIGATRAKKILAKYESLEDIYANVQIGDFSTLIYKLLIDGQQDAYEFRHLVTLRTDCNVELKHRPVPAGNRIVQAIKEVVAA